MSKTVLYIGIPFCPSKCKYCNLYYGSYKKGYINLLKKELKIKKIKNQKIEAVLIGGGTPNTLSISEFTELLLFIKDNFYGIKQISVELHPFLLNKKYIDFLYNNGVNRISIGIQTISKKINNYNNRLFNNNINNLILYSKNIGLDNINLDFIFDFEGEEFIDIIENLNFIKNVKTRSISIYPLENRNDLVKISNSKIRIIKYNFIKQVLYKLGYIQKSPFIFLLKGYKYSSLYEELIGYYNSNIIGLGVASRTKDNYLLIENTHNFNDYKKGLNNNFILSNKKIINNSDEKYIFFKTNLLINKYLDIQKFNKKINGNIFEIIGKKIFILNKLGYIKINNGKIYLTNLGIIKWKT